MKIILIPPSEIADLDAGIRFRKYVAKFGESASAFALQILSGDAFRGQSLVIEHHVRQSDCT